MPIIDDERGVLVLRLVYDGPPLSGKTTTLRTLARGLGVDIVTPEERDGRTMYFDWLDYVGGIFDGRRIRCQVVSVPGQTELASRREALLESADAVVLVADSLPEPFGRALQLARELVPILRQRRPPTGVVVQANKRDAPGALSRSELRDRLDRIAPIALTETIATSGDGVREAFVLGVRLALDRVRALAEAGAIPRGRPDVDDPTALLDRLRSLPTVTVSPTASPLEVAPPTAASEVAPPAASVVSSASASISPAAPRSEPADPVSVLVAAIAPSGPVGADAHIPAPRPIVELDDEAAETTAVASNAPPPRDPVHVLVSALEERRPEERLFRPDPNMPSGFIWPPVDGRTLLHEVAQLALVPERTSRGDWSASGGGWRFHSRGPAIYADVNEGRAALIAWARLHAASSRLLSPGRALILADAGREQVRLWQLVRVEAPLRETLEEASTRAPGGVVLALMFATMQLVRARQSLSASRARLPCTLWTVGTDAMRQPIFVGVMPEEAEGADPEPELDVASLVRRELGPVLAGLARDRSDYDEIVGGLSITTDRSAEGDGLRALHAAATAARA